MARVYTILLQTDGCKELKQYKNFDATTNSEQIIASALYDGYAKINGKGAVYITNYYADGYSHWNVKNGKFHCDVTKYDDEKDLNHELIEQLFNAYKADTQKPVKIVEAYSFIKAKRQPNLPILTLSKGLGYDYKIFENFIANVLSFPQKYSDKVYDLCKIVYSGNHSLYSASVTDYPDWLKPKGLEFKRLATCTWKMSAEIDGQIVQTQVTYDSKGISKFGPVGSLELAGKLVEKYVLYSLEDAYKKYTENNMDYKINQVVTRLNRYIEDIRGEDFRRNYDKLGGHMRTPDAYIVDMTDLLNSFSDKRFNKDDVYAVISYFKNDPQMFQQYYDKSNKYMEPFYPWFEGRTKNGQKLFKNVPKK